MIDFDWIGLLRRFFQIFYIAVYHFDTSDFNRMDDLIKSGGGDQWKYPRIYEIIYDGIINFE